MDLIPTDSKDVRPRVHVRAGSMDGDDLVVYEDVNQLPADGEDQIRSALANHDVGRYPEGALIATFAPPNIDSSVVRAPEEVESDPYPREIELTEFPPEEGQLCHW